MRINPVYGRGRPFVTPRPIQVPQTPIESERKFEPVKATFPKQKLPPVGEKVAAVIPTIMKAPQITNALITSLIVQGVEVILVTDQPASNFPPQVKVVNQPKPFNYSLCMNLGRKALKADIYLFMNDDLIPPIHHHWVKDLVDPILKDEADFLVPLVNNVVPAVQLNLGPPSWIEYKGETCAYGGPIFVAKGNAPFDWDEDFTINCGDNVYSLMCNRYRMSVNYNVNFQHNEKTTRGNLDKEEEVKLFVEKYFVDHLLHLGERKLENIESHWQKPLIAQKILLLKPDHYGDIAESIEAILMLRDNADITVACGDFAKSLFEKFGIPTIPYNLFTEGGSASAFRGITEEEKALWKNFDLIIDMRTGTESLAYMEQSGVPFVHAKDVLKEIHNSNNGQIMRQFIASLNIWPKESRVSYWQDGEPLKIVIGPHASHITKQFPHYERLVNLLKTMRNVQLYIATNDPEKSLGLPTIWGSDIHETAEKIVQLAPHVYIGNDSGLSHYVGLVSYLHRILIPKLILHTGVSHIVEWQPGYGPTLSMRRAVHCAPCQNLNCVYNVMCLSDLQMSDVLTGIGACLNYQRQLALQKVNQ